MIDNAKDRPSETFLRSTGLQSSPSENDKFMVALYCGSRPGRNARYAKHIKKLAKLLSADGRFGLVFGDGPGLMAIAANEFLKRGLPVVPITTHLFTGFEAESRRGENVVAPCIDVREILLRSMSNGTVLGPGGFGSLKEGLGDIVSHQMALVENKLGLPCERERPLAPLLIMNTANYYDPQIAMLQCAVDEGFANEEHLNLFKVCSGPKKTYKKLVAMYEAGNWTPKNLDPRCHLAEEMHHLVELGRSYGPKSLSLTT